MLFLSLLFFIINVGDGLLAVPMSRTSATWDKPGGLSLQKIYNQPPELLYHQLSQQFLSANDFQNALLINSFGASQVPASSLLDSQKNEIIYKMNEPYFIEEEIIKWESLAAKYPGYRDAWAQLAYLNLKLGRIEETRRYVEKIREINPNWVYLEKLTSNADY